MQVVFSWKDLTDSSAEFHTGSTIHHGLHSKSFVFGAIFAAGVYCTVKLIKSLGKKEDMKKGNSCLLFSPYQSVLGRCFSRGGSPCSLPFCPICNYRKFESFLEEASSRVDICVYLITIKKVADIIDTLFKRGVSVRIITDKEMSMQANGAKVAAFEKSKIPIKVIHTADLMHNKFVIIDQKTLITGSFNWTWQGVTRNFENAVIIRDEAIVKKFANYFEDLWTQAM